MLEMAIKTPQIPFGTKGIVVGPCSDPEIPDADNHILVKFEFQGQVIYKNMHIDDIDRNPPSQPFLQQ